MHCHECGQNINTDKAFCSGCGAKIRQIAHNEVPVQTKAPVAAAKNPEASLSLEYGPLKWDNIIVLTVTVVLLLALLVNFLGESSDEPSLKNDHYTQTSKVEKHPNGKTEKFYKQNGYTFINTSNYKGWTKDGKYNGYGVQTWTNGELYKGEFKDDKAHGYGVHTWAYGDHYKGKFRNDEMHGYGVYAWADGDRYEGKFRNGKMHGYGVYAWADGDRYEGQWRNGKKHGIGLYTFKNGEQQKGKWKYGKLEQ